MHSMFFFNYCWHHAHPRKSKNTQRLFVPMDLIIAFYITTWKLAPVEGSILLERIEINQEKSTLIFSIFDKGKI